MRNSVNNLHHNLLNSGISSRKARRIERGAQLNIVNREYLVEIGLTGKILNNATKHVKDYYFDSGNIDRIANTNNFFRCNEEFVHFWGMDINSKSIKINKKVEKLLKHYGYEMDDEIIEIYDDDSVKIFENLYLSSK